MRSLTLFLGAVAIMAPFTVVNGAAFRCGWLSFLGTNWACGLSCKVQGYVSKLIFR